VVVISIVISALMWAIDETSNVLAALVRKILLVGFFAFLVAQWHTLSTTSTGSTFVFFIDGSPVLTEATAAGSDLQDVMIQGYNFGQAGSTTVYWDNVSASSVPEPATATTVAALAVLGFAHRRRRRTA
jgi:MYXO-CTERM domain-containing protein